MQVVEPLGPTERQRDFKPLQRFEANRPLAYHVLKRYCRRLRLDPAEYRSAALAGLWHAANHWRVELGFQFSTYAWECIEGQLKNAREKFAWPKRLIVGGRQKFLKSRPDDRIETDDGQDRREVVETLLSGLARRQREIVTLRYGLGGEGPYTYEELGRVFGVTKERARQIVQRAVRDLRDLCHSPNGMIPAALRRAVRIARDLTEPDGRSYNAGFRSYGPSDDPQPSTEVGIRAWEDADAALFPPA